MAIGCLPWRGSAQAGFEPLYNQESLDRTFGRAEPLKDLRPDIGDQLMRETTTQVGQAGRRGTDGDVVTPEIRVEVERLLALLKMSIVTLSPVRQSDSWDTVWAMWVSQEGRHAACNVAPSRNIVFAPNYAAHRKGLLATAITRGGLSAILQWTNRITAMRRYRELAMNEPIRTVPNVSVLPISLVRDD
jgi:hypothetical protein